jgi:hypothetical protein
MNSIAGRRESASIARKKKRKKRMARKKQRAVEKCVRRNNEGRKMRPTGRRCSKKGNRKETKNSCGQEVRGRRAKAKRSAGHAKTRLCEKNQIDGAVENTR